MKNNANISTNNNWITMLIKWITYGAVVIIPLFFGYQHLFPFTTPKYLLIIFTSLALFGLTFYHRIIQNIPKIRITPISVSLIIFSLILIITSITSINPHRSWFGDWGQVSGIIFILSLINIALSASYATYQKIIEPRKIIFWTWLASIIVAIISYFPADTLSFTRDGSTLGNSSYLGAYLLITALLGIGLVVSSTSKFKKIFYSIGTLTILLSPTFFRWGVFTNYSWYQIIEKPWIVIGKAQGAVLGIGLGIIVILCLFLIRSQHTIKKYIGIVLLLGIIGSVGYIGLQFSQPNSPIQKLYSVEKTSNRPLFWDIARQGFVEKPLLGHGFGNYDLVYQDHFSSKVFSRGYMRELWVAQPHNSVWEYAVTTGIIGLIGYLAIFIAIFFVAYRISLLQKTKEEPQYIWGIIMMGIVVGYFFQNLFLFDTVVPFFILMILIGLLDAMSPYEKIVSFRKPHQGIIIGSVSLVMIGFVSGVTLLVIKPWQESQAWEVFTTDMAFENLGEEIADTEKISLFGDVQNTSYFVEEYLKSMRQIPLDEVFAKRSAFIEQIDGFIQELERQIPLQGDNLRTYMILGQLYTFKFGIMQDDDPVLLDTSIDYLNKALEITREHPLIYMHLSQAYLLADDFDHAIGYARSAIAIAPEFEGSYIYAEKMNELLKKRSLTKYINEMRNTWSPYLEKKEPL